MLVKGDQLIRAEMRSRLKKLEERAIHRKRKWVAEQVIGQIKDGFGVQGSHRAWGEVRLYPVAICSGSP